MKNEVTFQIEIKQLQDFMHEKKFEDADKLCSRMLDDYNKLDYELLLKRARIRQCLMKYDEAVLDANLALQILPQRIDAYYVLSDFLVAQGNYSEALKLLEILHAHDSSDLIIKSQYEQIKEKEKKKQSKAQAQRLKSKYDGKDSFIKITEQQMKVFQEDLIKERSIEPHQDKVQKHLEDGFAVLSDELDEYEHIEEESLEKPGNAQHLETPRVIQPLDFRIFSFQELFDKKKEAYKMRYDKLTSIDCQLCKLVFDYTSTCQHYSQLNASDMEDLKHLMPGIQGQKDLNAKKQALQKVTKSLDVLSTFKVTSLTLLQGQFSEIVALYLKRDLSALLGDNSENICTECVVVQKDPQNQQKPVLSLAEHALILVNRSLTYQIQALLLNEKEDLINVGGLEEEKANFQVDSKIANSVLEEIKIELKISLQKQNKDINFQSLHYLTRSLTDIMILTQDQIPLFNQIRQAGIIKRFLEIMNQADTEILKDKRNKGPQFCMFITHAFRFFILCSSIDPKAVTYYEEPSLKQVLRKYELYEKAFPMNVRLINSLKTDYLWFKHSTQGCNLKGFYKEIPVKVCGNCGKQNSDLKICSRCMKIYYCDRECQKNHYQKHKIECGLALTQLQ